MKLRTGWRSQNGGVLVVTLFMSSLFGLFLFGYLNLVRSQRAMVARSQAWNSALALAEAGAEEALAHLNPGAPQPVIDRAGNGWGRTRFGACGPMVRNLNSGSYGVVFTDDRFPIIYSTGYVSVPSIPAKLKRIIRVETTNAPLFTVAMAARYNIDFLGNGVSTDSFDSANPAFSNNGRYPVGDPTRTSTNGDVASIQGILNVGNGNVNGAVLLGPTATDTIGSRGQVSGGVFNDFNVEFEDVILPPATWLPAISRPRLIDGLSYAYIFEQPGPQSYVIPNLSGGIYVGTNANVTLKLMGNANPSAIRVAGAGTNSGKLTIYMTGNSFTLNGASAVDGGNALNLAYYGTTNNTELVLGGNASFTGTIYAPQANFRLGGGGSSIYDFVGSSVTATVRMNGHFNFHYDENLRRAGPVRPYVAHSWREL